MDLADKPLTHINPRLNQPDPGKPRQDRRYKNQWEVRSIRWDTFEAEAKATNYETPHA